MKTAEFGQPASHLPEPGKCRICGCGQVTACEIPAGTGYLPEPARTCGWADQTRTLCNAPACIAEAKREIGR